MKMTFSAFKSEAPGFRGGYGHTHHRVSFNVGRTLLTNVSIGYPGQMDLIDSLDPFTFELEE
jgi:hypothetical protein